MKQLPRFAKRRRRTCTRCPDCLFFAINSSDARSIALIASLPPDQAEAVMLRTVLGFDAPTAARILGKRPGAVRVATHRGLRTLERKLSDGV